MAKGGYQILDLSKDPFINGVSHTVHGAYNLATVANNHKAILLEGIRLGASTLTASTMTPSDFTQKNAEWVNFTVSGDTVTTTLSDNTTVTIANDDSVTVSGS